MSRTTYIIFSTIIIVISMIISYGSSDSDGSRMHSGGYYGGSGFSGCERRRDTILTHRPRNGIRHPDGGRNLPAD